MCATYAHDILAIYGLNIKYDSSETHPNKLCSSCYRRLINTKRTTNDDSFVVISTKHIEDMWIPHSTDCRVCVHSRELLTGYRAKLIDPPQFIRIPLSYDHKSLHIFTAPENTLRVCPTHMPKFTIIHMHDAAVKTFICEICCNIFDTRSGITNCGHYFCSPCLSSVLERMKRNDVECPVCGINVNFHDVHKRIPRICQITFIASFIMPFIGDVSLECVNIYFTMCDWYVCKCQYIELLHIQYIYHYLDRLIYWYLILNMSIMTLFI